MYKVNDYVVYKKSVCKIREIKKNQLNGNSYYVLVPVGDPSLIIDVPIDNKLDHLRNILSKQQADTLIDNICNIEPLDNIDNKYIERIYKDLLTNGTVYDLIKIIKTTYLRNADRIKNNKKISEKDNDYFNRAEKYLYTELSIIYDMSFDDVKNYIIKKVQEKLNSL